MSWPVPDAAHSQHLLTTAEGRSSLHRRWRRTGRPDHMICRVASAMGLPIDWKYASQNHRAWRKPHCVREELEAPSQAPLGRGHFLILKEEQAQGKSLPAVQGKPIRVGFHPRQSKRDMSTGTAHGIQFRCKRNDVGDETSSLQSFFEYYY